MAGIKQEKRLKRQADKQSQKQSRQRFNIAKKSGLISGIVLLAILAAFSVFFFNGCNGETAAAGEDLIINKSELTQTAKFYPYQSGKSKMEVLALKASDGTIRTAFNTCQVCYSSGRGYYELDGNVLVCQNCGNRFEPDQVEMQKGGCNPIPIDSTSKTDDGQNIVISGEFLQQAKAVFSNWK